MPKYLVTTLLALSLLVGAGCARKEPLVTAPVVSDTNPTTDETTVPDFDIVTTTYNGSDELAISAIVEPGVTTQKKQDGTLTTVPTPSYTAAINDYGAARFQFANCSGNPGSLTIAKGRTFMLDNRDNLTHQFAIANRIYQLKAYDFALVQITKPGNFPITCDGGGAAQVTIQ